MKRRNFLASAALCGGMLIPLGRHAWAVTAGREDEGGDRRRLIVVMLRGAVDGLNVVAPYADPEYARLRPDIALARPGAQDGAIDLDGYFGLHPALADLQPLWAQKKLAFVHACGSPDPTRSHFDAQDYLESGTPGKKNTPDGWLNRLAMALPGPLGPTGAIGIGPVLPRILSGRAPAANLAYGAVAGKPDVLDRPAMAAAFDTLYRDDSRFGRAYREAREAHRQIMAASSAAEMQEADGGAPLPNGFPNEAARLAALMRSDSGIRIAFIALGGWDTHANQGAGRGQLANRLAPLGQGLAELARRLGPLFDDTAIVVVSEFGRTVRQNGNGGTDHGHGNVFWLLGGKVAGGKVYADWPGLQDAALYEGRDLAMTTDFRAVLAQLAQRHMRLPDRKLAALFPGFSGSAPAFDLFRT